MTLKYLHKTSALLILFICFLTCNVVYSQQSALFPEYNYNPLIINPAYAGLLSTTEVTLSNTGFSNFEGAPRNLNLSFHTPLQDGKMGLGAAIIRDQIGVTNSTNAFLAYSYKIFFDFKSDRPYWQDYQAGSLSFAITAGVQQFQDNLLNLGITDDVRFSENVNASIPNIGAGILFNHARFYAGISAPNLIGLKLASEDNVNIEFPIYGYLGYRFFSNRFEDIMVKPSILLRHEKGAPLLADLNVSISYRNKFELGAGYRSTSSVNLLAGVYLADTFRIIYHYNMETNNSPLGNTHGIILSFRFNNGYQAN
ncbi:PorP/SprF family type IX secretion system membrane protein [Hyunsoonleella sp. 2307UL5-6]|uniref:PorP/SprF family type IX secretion system membrane protein n=1 Tax=Hyunsoonleella sp. 2307UL5-6 TaxID=3384768 RepID=UPI0039BD7D4C